MTTKVKTIKLVFPVLHRTEPHINCYQVVQVTDSTDFSPGQQLFKWEIDDLCASEDWKVIVVAA